ncbi:phosphoheptose isomerase [Acetobacter aceti NRIC 0242]|uniref:Phosphoheptose isomerase n=1 Tax=Acetobacter aceti NBRC 14818 TaxID=887700 RepID=A0AB33IFA1_ACEAC|nr:D-sedoheptulose 7-phosphate isomerase [Acetobacter aceti]TCS33198.1 phosphoheptose isomerase [Acetobacter aceti NBRC 14818]BCK75740.1 phosphoheptose isomerase [Acetobacter aceti NBRC 14818]GAN57919.1 phosphoheptose isomerase [Acetobacter aceti NBRC 14818]GBO81081.1 phosphoheptose isomerase [Acetobacter aceti NRIC 0242]
MLERVAMDDAAQTVGADKGFMTDYLRQSAEAMAAFAQDEASQAVMLDMGVRIVTALENGGRLLIAGNGGSAADAQHIAGEFTARLMYDRRPLSAVALTTDTSGITAIGNDYGFADIFSRQVMALGREGDVFLGITTSGRSPNILRAFEAAREIGLVTAAFTGHAGVQGVHCDVTLAVPANWTPVIQQLHITAAHIVCGLVERALCPRPVGV